MSSSRLGVAPKTEGKMIQGILESYIGPGTYNTIEQRDKRDQIIEKHFGSNRKISQNYSTNQLITPNPLLSKSGE